MAVHKTTYRASADLTVTNLHSIATSATWVAGWTSGTIDNTSDLDFDKWLSGKITVAAAGLAAGEIRVYVYAMMDDANWPDIFSAGTEGTEGTATLHDTNIRDAHMRLLWSTPTDTTASQVYPIPKTSLASAFGSGVIPPKVAIFITHSTGANLAAAGNQVTHAGHYATST